MPKITSTRKERQERALKRDPMQRLLKNSAIDPETGCRVWLKSKSHNGYGKISIRGKDYRTHRLMWELTAGKLIEGLLVLHKCHNPACMNMEHLRLGTHQDNMDDMVLAGRQARIKGAARWNTKLTEREVKVIREMCKLKIRAKRIAEIFDISVYTVYDISSKTHKYWSHVT